MSYIVLIEEDNGFSVRKFAHVVGDDLSAAMEFLFAYEEALIDESDGIPVWSAVATDEIYNPKDALYILERDYRGDNSTNYVYFIELYDDHNDTTLYLMEDFADEARLDS